MGVGGLPVNPPPGKGRGADLRRSVCRGESARAELRGEGGSTGSTISIVREGARAHAITKGHGDFIIG